MWTIGIWMGHIFSKNWVCFQILRSTSPPNPILVHGHQTCGDSLKLVGSLDEWESLNRTEHYAKQGRATPQEGQWKTTPKVSGKEEKKKIRNGVFSCNITKLLKLAPFSVIFIKENMLCKEHCVRFRVLRPPIPTKGLCPLDPWQGTLRVFSLNFWWGGDSKCLVPVRRLGRSPMGGGDLQKKKSDWSQNCPPNAKLGLFLLLQAWNTAF